MRRVMSEMAELSDEALSTRIARIEAAAVEGIWMPAEEPWMGPTVKVTGEEALEALGYAEFIREWARRLSKAVEEAAAVDARIKRLTAVGGHPARNPHT